MSSIIDTVIAHHREYFPRSTDCALFASPGRINIIGEHIDYNGGNVLPAAIDKHIYICISRNNDGIIRFVSANHKETGEVAINNLHSPQTKAHAAHAWWVYPYGACVLSNIEFDCGLDFSFYSTLPVGAGMSSSASITVGTLYALYSLNNITIKSKDIALQAQKVEWDFAGVKCGIMDQMAIINGKKDNAIMLNTQTMEFSYIPVDTSTVRFILVNSGVKHSLRESAYNDRRHECERALLTLKKAGFAIQNLCDCSVDDLIQIQNILPQTEYKRTYHVIYENHRVHQFAREIQQYNLKKAGELLYKSHQSLSVYYEVSIPLIDEMVEWASDIDGVYGSRLMGGGFGGCTISMVALYAVEHFTRTIAQKFKKRENRIPQIYECSIEDGTRRIE
ncbi:MAG TPA: galactokinase [Spirochaetota bacterium]|nr:galactokinase [Spirochaetota bacterium]HOM09810.1 galactokinase [Spirochaetota bacterium]HPP49659.1 galactokinase [Spirochaetota bacterium]